MKSKSSSRRRDRSPDDPKSKRTKPSKPHSKSREKEKVKEETKSVPRKTRWQPEEPPKPAPVPEPAATKEKPSGPPAPRIKDFLNDKEKIVDLLFQTVTGAALQELIPDYLKKRSTEELKKLCLEQIKLMSDEVILHVISGKVDSSNKEEKVVEKEKILKPEQPSSPKKKEEKDIAIVYEKKSGDSNKKKTDKSPDAVSPSVQTTASSATEKITSEENEIPLVIKDEVAKALILPERDAELLELEMRARAIRSLLKAKSQSTNEEEIITIDD